MGVFQTQESHDSRSSSMSFALRWMHENLRLISLVAIVSLAMTFMLMVVLNVYSQKSVALVVDGRQIEVNTTENVLQHLLDEQAIAVSEHDKLSMPLEAELSDGDRIVIDRAVPVLVTADGKTQTIYTTEPTVQKLIAAQNITLSAHDKIFPSPGTAVSTNLNIKVVRVEKKLEQKKHTVPFEVVKKQDPTIESGKQVVKQQGQQGVVVQNFEKVFEDGKLVSTQMVAKTYTTKTMNKIIAIGTKKAPKVRTLSIDGPGVKSLAKSGITLGYKKALKNVTITAYSSEEDGIGTRTASGTRVKEGRTIAVDKNVIPMGWWVYIEGIGFRRAEDTGGAIKGHKIDLYIDSLKSANKFGRKKGFTVYVIGPNKPKAS